MNQDEEEKQKALIDNTAQGIFNSLRRIENERPGFERRWIWELLQNAVDAARPDQKAEVLIATNGKELSFAHDGRPFERQEVVHLIYTGSTKRESDIGKFGTGFLVTHVLSRRVDVTGTREDGKQFAFTLDRSGTSPEQLKTQMEETWQTYIESLGPLEVGSQYTAKYRYILSNISLRAAKSGIRDLRRIAPYVLAFNDDLGSIKVTDSDCCSEFRLASSHVEVNCVHKVITEKANSNPPELHELWIARNDDVEIAIKGNSQNDGIRSVETLEHVPRIFVGFPLFGTEDLSFPVIINSRKFEATDERDGIFLGADSTEQITQNKGLLEQASQLLIELVLSSESDQWEGLQSLLKLKQPPDRIWLDPNWYTDNLLKRCLSSIVKLRVLKTDAGNFITPEEALVPVVSVPEETALTALWDVCSRFSHLSSKIPAKQLAFEWAEIVGGWRFVDPDLASMEISVEKIAEEIEACINLDQLRSKLNQNVDEFETLNQYYRLVYDTNEKPLFDDKSILPNQNGSFRTRSTLYADGQIDERLKDISAKLDEDIRDTLIHSQVYLSVKDLLQQVKSEADVLNHIVTKIRQPIRGDPSYLEANVDLFTWLLEHSVFELIDGYPLLSLKEDIFSFLGKGVLLCPTEAWDETAREYSNLFPQDLVISSLYYKNIPERQKWEGLTNRGWVLVNPLYREKEKLPRRNLSVEHFLVSVKDFDDEESHELEEGIMVSKIAFLDLEDKGIINRIRKSKPKAREFLSFLFNYVIEEDDLWNSTSEVSCGCGENHRIYESHWMARLKSLKWVPVGKNRQDLPNPGCLALLLEDEKMLLDRCRHDKPSKLLSMLGVSIGGLMMEVVAKDDEGARLELDKAMGSLFNAYGTNPHQLSEMARLAEGDPGLFLKEVKRRLETKALVQRNQHVGQLFEGILKTALETALEGKPFKVERTGIGDDFVIENDFLDEKGQQVIHKVTTNEGAVCYIELKTTSQELVKMTFTQAGKARDQSERYALCVIKLDSAEPSEENVKERARFVMNIGELLLERVGEVETLSKQEHEIVEKTGDIEVEMGEERIRFRIHRSIWEESRSFQEFIETIVASK